MTPAQRREASAQLAKTDVRIRFKHDQIGTTVEASLDGAPWRMVELRKHGTYATRSHGGWGQVAYVMSTDRDERAYLDTLDAKGVKYTVVDYERSKSEPVHIPPDPFKVQS